jgi:hypothetical protein
MRQKERAMPITDIVIVSIIIFAFVTFATVLAWGDHQTREIARASRERALAGARVVSLTKNIAAQDAGHVAAEKGNATAKA